MKRTHESWLSGEHESSSWVRTEKGLVSTSWKRLYHTMTDDSPQPCTTDRARQVWEWNSRHSTHQLSNITHFKKVEATPFSLRTHEEDTWVLTLGETSVLVWDSLMYGLRVTIISKRLTIISKYASRPDRQTRNYILKHWNKFYYCHLRQFIYILS